MSILLMLVVLLALLGVLGAGIAGIVVFVSRNSKKSAGGGVQGVVGGWYPDPQDPVMDRYHDGQTWTLTPGRTPLPATRDPGHFA